MRINRGSSPRLGRDFSAKNDIILRRRGGGADKLFHGIVSFPELRYTVFRFPRSRVAREEETVLGWKTTRKLRPGEEEGTWSAVYTRFANVVTRYWKEGGDWCDVDDGSDREQKEARFYSSR